MKKNLINKIREIIKQNMFLRVIVITNIIFISFIIISLSLSVMFYSRVDDNLAKIEESKIILASLEKLAEIKENGNEKSTESSDILINKSLAGYNEVIPFIALLESLFSTIDPKSEITIRSKENQIFIDHFADYRINLKINDNAELFFKAFEELYNSRFITRINNFTLNYKIIEEGGVNVLTEAEFSIRLYLN